MSISVTNEGIEVHSADADIQTIDVESKAFLKKLLHRPMSFLLKKILLSSIVFCYEE